MVLVIPESASNVHGITTERALEEGINLNSALKEFSQAMDNSKILVAHNMNYDEVVLRAEFLRMNLMKDFLAVSKICTMQSSIDFCRIETPRGYKWPRLNELHKILFNADFEGAHDALADVKACNRCFFELQKRGIIQ
jgi:DNA polymerase III subunit epsilon